MAKSGQIQTNTAFGYVRLAWSTSSQSVAGNSSTIAYTLTIYRSSAINSSASKDYSITINEATVASGTTTIGGTGTKTIKSGTTSISHNADGTKTFSYSFSQEIGITWSGSNIGTVTGSGTGTLDTIPRATTPTLSASSVNMGAALTITTPRASTAFTHTLSYSFGGASGTIATGVGTSYTWTVPMVLANQVPNSTSGVGSITCKTYNGSTLIGTKAVAFTAKVPSSVVPTVSSITTAETVSGLAAQFGGYVQNKSKVKVTVAATGSYASTIKSYRTTVNGVAFTGATFTAGVINKSGTVAITTTVTDSRGRSGSKTVNITLLAYSAPAIQSFTAVRSTAAGVEDSDGTYAKVTMRFSVAPVGDKNARSYALAFKEKSATSWANLTTGAVYSYNGNYVSTSAVLSTDKSYDLRLTVTDYFGSVTATTWVSTAFTLMDFNAAGNAVAFGKVSERPNAVEFGLPMYSSHGELLGSPVVLESGTNLDSLLEPGVYMIGVSSVSGTITNKPLWLSSGNTGTAAIIVGLVGLDGQRFQRYIHCTKDGQMIFQRIYYADSWGAWAVVGGSTYWRTLTLASGFEVYGTGTEVKYRVSGNIVTVTGAVKPTAVVSASTNSTLFASGIPAEFRPTATCQYVCQGSGINRWLLTVNPEGGLACSRYGTTTLSDIPVGAWLTFTASYSI